METIPEESKQGLDGFAYIRTDLLGRENPPVGVEYYSKKEPLPYRWLGETDEWEGEFQVYYKGGWKEACSIDWDFDEVGKAGITLKSL